MTMTSMPPASSHLAESPVPAPPPMIGSPRRTIPWNLSIRLRRSSRGMDCAPLSDDLPEILHQRLGEWRVVDIAGEPDQPSRRRLPHHPLESREERRIGGRILERLARCIDERHAAFRDEETNRPFHAVEPFADPSADRL